MKLIITLLISIAIFQDGKSQDCITSKDSIYKVNSVFQLNHIQFEYDHWKLDSTSYVCLDSLVKFLEKNDSIIISIRSHIDFSKDYLDNKYGRSTTMMRAKRMTEYIIQKGIHPGRMVSTGMGSNELLISEKEILALKTKEEQKAARKKNERCDFKILSTEWKNDK